jgi:hypothetical protein
MRLSSLRGVGECVLIPGSSSARYVDFNTGVPCDPNSPNAVGPIYQGTGPVGYEGATGFTETSVPGFEGTITVPSLESRLSQDMYSRTSSRYMLERGLSAKPSEIGAILQESAAQYCAFYPNACAGVNVPALIQRFVTEYTAWYNSNLAEYHMLVDRGSIEPTAGSTPPPPAGYRSPVEYSSGPKYQQQQENALRPPPTGTSFDLTKSPTATGSDVLGPGATGNKQKENEQAGEGSWFEENWQLVAAGAAALLLIPMMGKR